MSKKKDQILDISLSLFLEKGFDKTSITDILEKSDIARGTLYYHFESKEAIMDAIIERTGKKIMSELEGIVEDRSLSSYEKLLSLFLAMNMRSLSGGSQMIDYLNQPQNALFHEKSNRMIIENASPLLGRIIRQGREEGIFETSFPEETAEIILITVSGFLDSQYLSVSKEELEKRSSALLYNIERMLGAKEGSFSQFRTLMIEESKGEDHESKL